MHQRITRLKLFALKLTIGWMTALLMVAVWSLFVA